MTKPVRITREQAKRLGLTGGGPDAQGSSGINVESNPTPGADHRPADPALPTFGVGNHPGAATHVVSRAEACSSCGVRVHRLVSSMEPGELRPRVCESCWKSLRRMGGKR